MPARRASKLALLAFVVLSVAIGFPDVAFHSVHPPGDDDLEFVVPFSLELRDALTEGRLPLWNPHIDGGVSFFARFPYLEPFYPSAALFLVLPPRAALDASLFLHLCAAAGGAAFLALSLGLRRPAAAVAALVYVQSSAFRGNVGEGYLTALVAFTWLPWLLAALERAFAARAWRDAATWVAAGAGALGLMLLGGQPTDVLACGLLTAAYVAVGFTERERRARIARVAGCSAAVVALGALLGAAFWWPALAAVSLAGGVPELPMKVELGGSLSDLLGYLAPHRDWGTSFGRHLSFPALGLAGWSLIVALRRSRPAPRSLVPWLAAAALSLVLSLGQATPLWGWLRAGVPFFQAVDTSVAYGPAFALAVSVLAALAFDGLVSRRAMLVLAALLASDALVYQAPAWRRAGFVEPSPPAAAHAVERFLDERVGDLRVLPLEMHVDEADLLFPRNRVMPLGLESVRISSHFPAARTVELLGRMEGVLVDWRDFSDERMRLAGRDGAVLEPTNARVLDLFSVRWLVTDFALPDLGRPELDGSPWRVYERRTAWPRLRVLDAGAVLPDAGCTARLVDPAFDPEARVLAGGRASLVARAPGALRVRVAAPAAALLFSGETYDPGWRATVDGVATPVVPVLCAFAGVAVPPGQHVVELRFVPRGLTAGLATSALALAILMSLWVVGRPRSDGRSPEPVPA